MANPISTNPIIPTTSPITSQTNPISNENLIAKQSPLAPTIIGVIVVVVFLFAAIIALIIVAALVVRRRRKQQIVGATLSSPQIANSFYETPQYSLNNSQQNSFHSSLSNSALPLPMYISKNSSDSFPSATKFPEPNKNFSINPRSISERTNSLAPTYNPSGVRTEDFRMLENDRIHRQGTRSVEPFVSQKRVEESRPKSEHFAWPPRASRVFVNSNQVASDMIVDMDPNQFDNLICNRCDEKLAIYYCRDCSKYFCENCNSELHDSGQWQTHKVEMF